MKRCFIVLLLLSIAPCITFAQSFKFQDDKTYSVHQWEPESNNDIKAYVINMTNMPLSMSWKLVSATIDSFTICDNETCLEGTFPGRTSMTALPPNEPIEFLKVSVATALPKNGKATYLVYATNEGEAAGKEFTFEITSTSAIVNEEVQTTSAFEVIPNPVADFFAIRGNKGAEIAVYDINGTLVYSTTLQSDHDNVNTSSFASGVYSIKLSHGAVTKFTSFIKQ
ncbi:MAG: T9SS type A sorting domain-containing protein [Candidatus Kapabacteria bacterium]|nr:T9SS type A sorting domain-containing protein [Candidatus Kapabacteria bacterium]